MKINVLIIIYLSLTSLLFISCDKGDEDINPDDQPDVPEGYSLVWADEFNGETIDAANWQYETGDGTDYGLQSGWGNSELQIYTENAENSGIEQDGDLSVLSIRATDDGSGNYTSAKLTTQNLFSMRFGRIDIKAKMPKGQGIWPAVWALGDNIDEISWPGCGEIDIVEILGHEPAKMYSTLHYTDSENKHGEKQGVYELSGETFNDAYHVFSLNWTPESLAFSIDGKLIQEMPIEPDMKEFLRSFYLVLNVAVGGNWPGNPDNTTSFPQTMYVDYIRVFTKDDFEAPDAPPLDIEEETLGQNIQDGLAQHAINDDFSDLGAAEIVVWGSGGEPAVSSSDLAINGDSSLVFDFPGENWGGGYMELKTAADLSAYSHYNFSLKLPASLNNAEIKLESSSSNAAVFLSDYTGTDVGEGFMEYSIPLSDFSGLDLSQITIPFSMWNPQDADENFVTGAVLIDNIYFSE
jgi:beta-glucanase (GH16 family)